MISALSSLVALQQLDTAAEAARKRLAELPGLEQQAAQRLASAKAGVEAAKASLAANHASRRELEKQVAAVDVRLARFDDHRAAVKTNQEYTALLHEIATAKSDKDTLEEQILVVMEAADAISSEIKIAEALMADVSREAETVSTRVNDERRALEAEVVRLGTERARASAEVDRAILVRYEQLLKQRRMIAVAEMTGETCTACHVRLRPAVAQAVRRNSEIVQCDSCQRILFFRPVVQGGAAAPSPAP
jgi:uncharacterized protein